MDAATVSIVLRTFDGQEADVDLPVDVAISDLIDVLIDSFQLPPLANVSEVYAITNITTAKELESAAKVGTAGISKGDILKLKKIQTSINDKTTAAKEQIILNTDTKFQLLTEQVNNLKEILSKILSDKFSELETKSETSFNNSNNLLKENIAQLNQRQDKQAKEIKLLKMIAIAIIVISVLGTILVLKEP